MSVPDRLSEIVTGHSRAVIALMLVVTVLAGAGAGMVEQSSSLDQFQSDTEEAEKLTYIEDNFATGSENTSTAQVIVRGENTLSKDSLVETLHLQQSFRENETISQTLSTERPTVGVANLVATSAILGEQRQELQSLATEFEQLNATVQKERAALARRQAALNTTRQALRTALESLQEDQATSPRETFEGVRERTAVELDETQYDTFNRSVQLLRRATDEAEIERAYKQGTQGVLADEYETLEQRSQQLEADGERLRALGSELEQRQSKLENTSPSIGDQIEAIESLNATQYERALMSVLGGDSNGQLSGLGFMPTDYEPGSASANATMLLVTHQTSGEGQAGAASQQLIDAQLTMQSMSTDQIGAGDSEVIVFGTGIMSDEINNSMGDSLAIVGPLALIFVVVALVVAYRDFLDILLGLFGIGAVLIWTFGFMGWAGIDFNQMFIAVPVLLIGLSIDYAIHIFMRHREQRQENGAYSDDDVRGSMRTALAGVGIALVLVTATTAIGFLSNLTSPVPPIQDFGIVSAVGITAALLIFGILIPAVKIEVDSVLENRGISRQKRAFGTGNGRFSSVLSAGATAAKKAPVVILLLALLVSAGGAYGASQVDTSFNQEDFIAEDPPAWTDNLPEPFAPGEYSMKENLEFVNQNFVREDSQAQLLFEGDVTDPETLQRLSDAQRDAAESDVVVTLSGGGADLQGPLQTMQQVAAENETFNATFTAADTDGDMVPDQNVEQVYDALFTVAPQEAGNVIYRSDDGYQAVRMVVSTSGTAAMSDVRSEMAAIADNFDSGGLETTATGQIILFDIVQDQLFDTVVESLLITLVAVFAFLMVTYRITDGSAMLGAVTLLPVLFSVTWILGTMYVLEIPFNVMTGMITSLTVGLGVAYSIHMSERYKLELDRTGSVWEAMSRTVTGTGGALLGSAATTVGGFGVLAFAILPPLQQFGIITGMTIIYAFLASVLVLPSLLVLWTKYFGPAASFELSPEETATPTASDGGRPNEREE
ncbi:hydrophobe/amphiphile efflux-3 (HAE3) family protein [Halovenus aranensis]|uniref:Hydrophobe/amphiphile efflux-3 (HAE3) family protein n=1 Tax=Halovenus aranensis TaxID=890420 RepID=A0A1G8TUG2_9EURY|nr:MMPL family transporter [Halovenus aranensis]SDJ45113.1 hydrophobe/amphiphile efflux-3 (HAE3) family protein [Halovenus aranensis]